MNIKTDGLVIREQFTGEADRVITVLTRDHGVIRAFANGARSIKSKNLAATQLLCYSDFNIYKSNKNVYSIAEANAKDVFFSLREDVVKLSLAQYFTEIADELAPREENADEFLRLLLNSLFFLANNKKSPALLKPTVELRMLSLSGYMPDLVGCCVCGKYESETVFFSTDSGRIYCDTCKREERTMEITSSVLASVRHICLSNLEKLFSFSISPETIELLGCVSEEYLRKTTCKKYKTLDFYKMMTQ